MYVIKKLSIHLQDGRTALHLACQTGREDVANLLLTKKADAKVQDKVGPRAKTKKKFNAF